MSKETGRRTVSIKVIQPTNTSINNLLQTRSLEDSSPIPSHGERLCAHSHRNLERIRTSRSLEGLRIPARSNSNLSSSREQRNHKHGVFHGLVSIRATNEVVSAGVAGVGIHAGICSVAVDVLWGRSVPVDELVAGDVAIDCCGAGFEGCNERFGEV
jgi:hypothetical protein